MVMVVQIWSFGLLDLLRNKANILISFWLTCRYFLLDLVALAVGYGIISAIIAGSRDSFAYMTSGRTHLLALNRSLIVFLWVSNLLRVVS